MSQRKQLVQKQQRYKSLLHISLITWNIALSSFYFGYCMVYMGALPFQTIVKIYSIEINLGTAQGILNGCIPIGALFGAIVSSLTIERISRKNNLLLNNLVASVLGLLIFIPNFLTFLLFRFGQGVCVGIFSGLAPLIIRQLAPVQLSGRLGIFVQLNITLGVLTGYLATYLLKQMTSDYTCESFWPVVFAIPLIVILIQSIVLLFVFPYQTPKYLLQQGQEQKAIQILKIIYKEEYVDQVLEQKRSDVRQLKKIHNINEESVLSEDEGLEVKVKKSKLANIMGVHIIVMTQMSGVNAYNVYCGPILNQATSPQIAMLLPTLMALQKLSTTFATTYLASKFGRKTILQIGIFLQSVASSLVAIGFLLHNQDKQGNQKAFEALVIIGVFFFMGMFGLSIGPISWVYLAQSMQPNKLPIATIFHWTACSLVVTLFPIIKENVLGGDPTLLFAFFTLWSFASLIINRFFLLETKDKTQQQIREEYSNYKIC